MPTPLPNTPRFGLATMTCVVIAGMIGSGVSTTSGFTLADLQSPARVLLAWSVGGAIAVRCRSQTDGNGDLADYWVIAS